MKPKVLVGRVERLESSPRAGPKWEATTEPSAHLVVQLAGGTALLDVGDARARLWADLLEDFRRTGEPLYLEADPETDVITRVLYPRAVLVTAVEPGPENGVHEVSLEISHARHFLDLGRPDSHRLLGLLIAARDRRERVLVTEDPETHEIVDVRDFPSRAARPEPPLEVSLFTLAEQPDLPAVREVFRHVAGQPHIPFQYPDDGCWVRAHEVARLLLAAGWRPRKLWMYGRLSAPTVNHPRCKVRWAWHVAPTLRVGAEDYVLDPALFQEPVTRKEWIEAQTRAVPMLHSTSPAIYYRSAMGRLEYDRSYRKTQELLVRFGRELAMRSARHGPPPYSRCSA